MAFPWDIVGLILLMGVVLVTPPVWNRVKGSNLGLLFSLDSPLWLIIGIILFVLFFCCALAMGGLDVLKFLPTLPAEAKKRIQKFNQSRPVQLDQLWCTKYIRD